MGVVYACIDTVQNQFLRTSDQTLTEKVCSYIPMLTPFPILPSAWTLSTPYQYHDHDIGHNSMAETSWDLQS